MIERVGSTVPQIKKVLKKVKKEEGIYNEKNFIKHCPSCNELLIEDNTYYFCKNKNCLQQIEERIYYFFSQLGLKGMGNKTIKELIKFATSPADILKLILKKTPLNLHGWEKFCFYGENIIKNINIYNLLSSLGIENLSNKSLNIIYNHFKINNLQDLKNFLENFQQSLTHLLNEEKNSIKHIGKEKLKSFLDFLNENKEEVINIINIVENLQ